jgi:hypothetical protein
LPVFENAFCLLPKLRLHDLTFNDIENYVYNKLAKDQRMEKLCRDNPVEAPECQCAIGLSFVLEDVNTLPEPKLFNILTPEEVSERVSEVDNQLRAWPAAEGLLTYRTKTKHISGTASIKMLCFYRRKAIGSSSTSTEP